MGSSVATPGSICKTASWLTIMRGTLDGTTNCARMHGSSGPNLQFPSSATQCTSSITAADPALGPLQDNGGPTKTMLAAAGTPGDRQGHRMPPDRPARQSARELVHPRRRRDNLRSGFFTGGVAGEDAPVAAGCRTFPHCGDINPPALRTQLPTKLATLAQPGHKPLGMGPNGLPRT